MRRILVIVLALASIAAAVWFVSRMLMSPEDHVREILEDAVAAFNEPDASDCVADVAVDFRDSVHGLGKRDLHRVLASLFIREHQTSTEFPYHAEISEDHVEIMVEVDSAATAGFTLNIVRSGKVVAQLALKLEFELREGDWLITSSSHEVVDGAFPF